MLAWVSMAGATLIFPIPDPEPTLAPSQGENSPHKRGTVPTLLAGWLCSSLTVVTQEDDVAGLSHHDNQGVEERKALGTSARHIKLAFPWLS